MPRRSTKLALSVGGALPTAGVVTAIFLANPWLTVALLGSLAALVAIACRVLLRRPFVELRETTRDGIRSRLWRVGVEPSPQNTIMPSSSSQWPSGGSTTTDPRSSRQHDDSDSSPREQG